MKWICYGINTIGNFTLYGKNSIPVKKEPEILLLSPNYRKMVMISRFHSESFWKARRIIDSIWPSSTSRRDSQGIPYNFVNKSPGVESRDSLWGRTSREFGA
jgi:hypothetical protein